MYDDDAWTLDIMLFEYLIHTFSISGIVNDARPETVIGDFVSLLVVAAVVYLVGLFIVFSMIYNPMIRSLDQQIKRTRSILLLFPQEVIRRIPAMRNLAMRITHQMNE
jgi:hypothetical protein